MIIDSINKRDEHKAVVRLVDQHGNPAILGITVEGDNLSLTVVDSMDFEAKVSFAIGNSHLVSYCEKGRE